MKVLIIDKMHDSILPLLKEIGVEGHYRPEIKRDEILSVLPQYDGIIVRSKTSIDAELISKGSKLKFVARAGAGVDNVDLEALKNHEVELLNAPEGNRDALAEHAIGMLLALLNNIHNANNQIRNGIWDREGNRGVEIKDKTIGLLGFGHMGEAFAKRLTSFGCEIIAHDHNKSGFSDQFIKEVSLKELQERSQILSFHIPLNEKNRGFINHQFLNNCKNLEYILNTSRGEVLILKDLVELLKSNKIKGAALDVLENEKIDNLSPDEQAIFDDLLNFKQVILSPHVAGWSFESYEKINQILSQKIEILIEKKDFS